MQAGYVISGIAHAGFIGWALFGGMFTPKDQDIVVNNVSVLSEAEFQAMITSDQVPEVPQFDLTALEPSEDTDVVPTLAEQTDQDIYQSEPEQPEPVAEEITPPEPVEPLVVPTPDITTPDVQPPAPQIETAMMLPDVSTESAPIQANRVAPTPVAPPEQPAIVDDVTQEATVPADAIEPPVEDVPEVKETTAPEAASSEIITEAKKEDAKRQSSPRPKLRPSNFKPTPPKNTGETNLEDILRKVTQSDTLEASKPEPSKKSGPPLTDREHSDFSRAVGTCWDVDVGGRSANVTVTLSFSMNSDGRIPINSIILKSSDGGTKSEVKIAFDKARRALIRCQRGGYTLPPEKYESWKEHEMVFDPAKMRNK
jgi:hypothetical protein